jgi:hypothetical protein
MNVDSQTLCKHYKKDNQLTEIRKYYNIIQGESVLKSQKERMIKFLFDFYEPIRCGLKTATTRITNKNLNINDVVIAVFPYDMDDFNKNVIDTFIALDLQILKVEELKFNDLTNAHALSEGYQHVNLLKHELKNIYPHITDDTSIYFYKFQVIKEM